MSPALEPPQARLGRVDIFESWVLAVAATDNSARIDLDLVVLPGHPAYTGPKVGEQQCYVGGILRFEDAKAVVFEPSNLQPAISADKTLDLGQIDEWESDAGYHRLSGEWGELEVWGGEVSIGVDFAANYLTEFLAGLPSYGSPALTIADGESGMREGRVLRVHTGRGDSWIANVQRGWSNSPDQVLRTPHCDRFVLVAGGRGWCMDATQPGQATLLDGWVHGGAALLHQGLLLVVGEMYAAGIDADGVRWSTHDFGPTYGAVSVVRSDADTVTVELTDAISDELTQVRMRLADGMRLAR